MLIPGTSSVDHLRENIAGAALALPPDAVAELDAILSTCPPSGVELDAEGRDGLQPAASSGGRLAQGA